LKHAQNNAEKCECTCNAHFINMFSKVLPKASLFQLVWTIFVDSS